LVSSPSQASLNDMVPVLELPPPPDGGWGWAIVAASFMSNFVLDGIAYSFGVLLAPLADHFGASRASVAWVGSLLAGIYQVTRKLLAISKIYDNTLPAESNLCICP